MYYAQAAKFKEDFTKKVDEYCANNKLTEEEAADFKERAATRVKEAGTGQILSDYVHQGFSAVTEFLVSTTNKDDAAINTMLDTAYNPEATSGFANAMRDVADMATSFFTSNLPVPAPVEDVEEVSSANQAAPTPRMGR